MANPILLLDRIENARAETSFTTLRTYRTFLAYDIDTSVPSHELIGVLGVAGMPQIGDVLPGFTYTKVVNHIVESAAGSAAKGQIVYEGPRGDTLLAYIAEQSSSLVQRERQYIRTASGYKAIQTKKDIPSSRNGQAVILTNVKTATLTPMLPCITVTLSAFKVPFPLYLPTFGCVNDRVMGGQLYADAPNMGYWLFCGKDIKTQSDGVNYDLRYTLMSLVDQDWSEVVYFTESNGEKAIVSTEVFNSLLSAGYVNDVVQGVNAGDSTNAGISRVGMYRTTDMTAFSIVQTF
jgi:hypothetical protein